MSKCSRHQTPSSFRTLKSCFLVQTPSLETSRLCTYIRTSLAELGVWYTMGTKLRETEGGMGVTIRNGIGMKEGLGTQNASRLEETDGGRLDM
jgi:hypothetical protein